MPRKRTSRLIDRNLQVGLTVSFAAVAAAGAVLQAVLVARSLEALALRSGELEALRGALPGLLMRNLLITVAVLVAATWGLGILITHRVAGPLHRLERYLEALAAGETAAACTIRHDDELQGLVDKLNRAVEQVRARERGEAPERAA